MGSSSIKQCLWYQVKIITAKLSFSPQPLRFWRSHLSETTPLHVSEWMKLLTSCDFVISSWSSSIKHSNTKICLPKHPKTALLTFLVKRCAESVTPCQSHFSGELGSSEKTWPNFLTSSIRKLSTMIQLKHEIKRQSGYFLNNAYYAWFEYLNLKKVWTSELSQVSICCTQGPWSGYRNCMWRFSFEVSYVKSSFSEMVRTLTPPYISQRILRFLAHQMLCAS